MLQEHIDNTLEEALSLPSDSAFDKQPDEIVNAIMLMLPLPALLAMYRTCRRLRRLARDEKVWRLRTLFDHGLAYKATDLTWLQNYYTVDHSDTCPHLNLLACPKYMTEFRRFWCELFASSNSGARQPDVICSECTLRFDDLWLCMSPGCGNLGCGRMCSRHAIQHSGCHKPRVVSMKLTTLEMWCYECEKWLGVQSGPHDEHTFLLDWQRRLLEDCASAIPGTGIGPTHIDCPTLPISHSGYPQPPLHSLWYRMGWNERRQREREISLSLTRERLVFIDNNWMKSWTSFVIGTGPPPGPINNYPISTYNRSHRHELRHRIQSMLQPDEDFWVLPPKAWRRLHAIYGGGPFFDEESISDNEYALLRDTVYNLRRQLIPHNVQEEIFTDETDSGENDEDEDEDEDDSALDVMELDA